MANTPVLMIQVFREGNRYEFEFEANIADRPPLRRSPFNFIADTPLAAVEGALDAIKRLSHHPGRGRKPRGHWVARHLVNG